MPCYAAPATRAGGAKRNPKKSMINVMPFVCSICEEQSTRICVRCTKDTCSNHLCDKCGACSDCCDCEVHLNNDEPPYERPSYRMAGPHEPDEPKPHPMPDPDPAPDPDPMPETRAERYES
jgi:hypothetical protein